MSAPTIRDLAQNILSRLSAAFSTDVPQLPKGFLPVLSQVLSATSVISYKYVGFGILQIFVATASYEETTINGRTIRPLVFWGQLLGVGDPDPARPAEIVISFDVLEQGGTLEAFKQLTNDRTGVVYEVAFEVALNSPTVQATIRPISTLDGGDGSGTIGNMSPGDTLDFSNSPPSIAPTATVLYQTVTGQDAEDPEHYRARVLRRKQRPPQGGALADYREWGEIEGIANIYPKRGNTPGTVDVYIEATVESFGNDDGIPTLDQRNQVNNAIKYENPEDAGSRLATRSPVNDKPITHPIQRIAFDIDVIGSLNNTPFAELEQAADEYFRSREPFLDGLSVFPRKDRISQIEVGAELSAIASSYGDSVESVTLKQFSVITPGRSLVTGEKAKLGILRLV